MEYDLIRNGGLTWIAEIVGGAGVIGDDDDGVLNADIGGGCW